jgi:GIY-YIG catalytic domain
LRRRNCRDVRRSLSLAKIAQTQCDPPHSQSVIRIVILSEAKDLLAMRHFYVYILSSKSRVLYTGITDDIYRRTWEHKNDVHPGSPAITKFIVSFTMKRSSMSPMPSPAKSRLRDGCGERKLR